MTRVDTAVSPDTQTLAITCVCPAQCQIIEALEGRIAELRRLTAIDYLTGVSTRVVLEEAGARELSRLRRYAHPSSLVFCDIDAFKRVNDDLGHGVGDEVLRAFAARLTGSVRDGDIVGRIGGEEFVLVLPNTGTVGASLIAERVRAVVEARPFASAGAVTASFGVAQACRSDAWPDWLGRADSAMYEAKRAGGNRVVAAPLPEGGGHNDSIAEGFLQLVWRGAYECGHPLIDSQHRALFATANELLACAFASNREQLMPLLSSLLRDCKAHFEDEERILSQLRYPGLADHALSHRELLARAQDLAADAASIGDLVAFLARDVIAGHILKDDRSYFPLLQGLGATSGP